eukprot:456276-Lingulodinium_polyedra.AAC.1
METARGYVNGDWLLPVSLSLVGVGLRAFTLPMVSNAPFQTASRGGPIRVGRYQDRRKYGPSSV